MAENHMERRSRFQWLTDLLKSANTWLTAAILLWPSLTAAFAFINEQSNLLEATLIGFFATIIVIFLAMASLACWRYYRPLPAKFEQKRALVYGARSMVISYAGSGERFAKFARNQASYLQIRRHLSREIVEYIEGEDQGLSPKQLVGLFLNDVDRIAANWGIY